MTVVIGPIVVIEREPPRKCELCGKEAECRPYGPNGEQVCVECGRKDEKATEAAMRRRFLAGWPKNLR